MFDTRLAFISQTFHNPDDVTVVHSAQILILGLFISIGTRVDIYVGLLQIKHIPDSLCTDEMMLWYVMMMNQFFIFVTFDNTHDE